MNSFKDDINPSEFRYSGTVESPSITTTNGIPGDPTWPTHEASVRLAKLNPRRGGDATEGGQTVAVAYDSWLIRAEDRAYTTDMRVVINSINYYIKDIRNYKGSPLFLVLDTEQRDNE
ncbi:MAG: phage head completion protein [Lewinella sp.]|uniref:phage head completion protein n=1 Tax=Lewinella sp. TaxID=2004506 RepID=UPI003D6BC724